MAIVKQKLVCASVVNFANVSDFFKDFYLKNKKINSKFSYRYIAGRLKWPEMLFSDVANGRKSLSLRRALEFSGWVQMDVLETEGLALMTLSEGKDGKTVDLINDLRGRIYNPQHPERGELIVNYSFNLDTILVYAIIVWARGAITAEEILAQLEMRRKLTLTEINRAIEALIKEEFLDKDTAGKGYKLSGKEIVRNAFDFGIAETFTPILEEYAEILPEFLPKEYFPFALNHTILELPFSRNKEIFEKLTAFKNWLYQISRETKIATKTNLEDTVVFQLGLDLFPVHKAGDTAKEKLKSK